MGGGLEKDESARLGGGLEGDGFEGGREVRVRPRVGRPRVGRPRAKGKLEGVGAGVDVGLDLVGVGFGGEGFRDVCFRGVDLERAGSGGVGFAGGAVFAVDGARIGAGGFVEDVGLEESILGVENFDGSLVGFGFQDDFFGVFGSGGGGVVFWGVGFSVATAGGVAFAGGAAFGVDLVGRAAFGVGCVGGATFGTGSARGATFCDLVFGNATCWAIDFSGASFENVVFALPVVARFGSGARSINDASASPGAVAENCPAAIWRARSLTLTNILSGRVHVQQNAPGDAHAFYD